jgi:hypothetical protein
MAARGIRDTRMGHPGIQPSRGPHLGRPVMTHQPMIRPASPPGLPSGMPPGLQGPQPVNPAGPVGIQPSAPPMMAPKMRV